MIVKAKKIERKYYMSFYYIEQHMLHVYKYQLYLKSFFNLSEQIFYFLFISILKQQAEDINK